MSAESSIQFTDIDFSNPEACTLLATWFNAPSTKHLYSRFPDAASFERSFTTEYFLKLPQYLPTETLHRQLFILKEGRPIGHALLEIDPPKLMTKTPNTAWIALLIADTALRGQGLGKQGAHALEALAKDAGAERIEISIFEYNTRSLAFFTILGYQEFARRKDWAYWNGQMWSEIRLIKSL